MFTLIFLYIFPYFIESKQNNAKDLFGFTTESLDLF